MYLQYVHSHCDTDAGAATLFFVSVFEYVLYTLYSNLIAFVQTLTVLSERPCATV